MGISRLTAAAYIIALKLNPHRDKIELTQTLCESAPSASPNIKFFALADDLLPRNGRMMQAGDVIV